MAPTKDIVLVTGSSGCLGQHIVKLLQERDDHTREIRLFDIINYANKLGHPETKEMKEFVADVRNAEKLLEAMEGVDCVIHTAAFIDNRVISDDKTFDSVNVDGTQAVIDACLKKNVSRLIFASSTDILCEKEPIFYGSENTIPAPKTFMLKKYGETKWKAEDLVVKANGQLCSDGKTALRTIALRPTPLYGEEDKYLVTPFLKLAKRSNGCHYRVKRRDELFQCMYVGNAAWAFLKAKEKLSIDDTISGEIFIITDDTDVTDIHEFVQPYLEARGFRTSPYVIPYWLAWFILTVITTGIRMINAIMTADFDVPNVMVLNYLCTTFFYNGNKATLRLDYHPIYDPEEARRLSMLFYTNVRI